MNVLNLGKKDASCRHSAVYIWASLAEPVTYTSNKGHVTNYTSQAI